MKKYKALFLDVDGTTVIHGVDNLPSPGVTQAVKRAMQAGIIVSLATSRPPKSVMHIIKHLGLNGCVLSSGAQIYDRNPKIIIEKEFRSLQCGTFSLPQEVYQPQYLRRGERIYL